MASTFTRRSGFFKRLPDGLITVAREGDRIGVDSVEGLTLALSSETAARVAADLAEAQARTELSGSLSVHIASVDNPHNVTKAQVGLASVEDTALSTWAGSVNITTVGTIVAGMWQGNAIADAYISSASNWNTAYSERHQWDGGATGLVAATGRASLELGSLATQNSNAVTITGGTISGLTSFGVGTTTIDPEAAGAILRVLGAAASNLSVRLEGNTADGASAQVDLAFGAASNTAGTNGTTRIALIRVSTTGSTANNRGGNMILFTKADGSGLVSVLTLNSDRSASFYGPLFIGSTTTSSSATLNLPVGFSIFNYQNVDNPNRNVISENVITGTGVLDIGDNSAGRWTSIKLHAGSPAGFTLTGANVTIAGSTTAEAFSGTKTTASQLTLSGWENTQGASIFSGEMRLGNDAGAQGRIHYEGKISNIFYIDHSYNNDNGDIYIRTKTNGTPVNAVVIKGSGFVGFGMSPVHNVDIVGILSTRGGATTGATLDFGASSTPSEGVTITTSYVGSGSYGPLIFKLSGSEKVRITEEGNIIQASGYFEGVEIAEPAAPSANGFRLFAQDNGAGKTQLMVRFASGASQQIVLEP